MNIKFSILMTLISILMLIIIIYITHNEAVIMSCSAITGGNLMISFLTIYDKIEDNRKAYK